MSRKNLMRCQARVSDGSVTITCYKGTPLFRREKGPCPIRILRKAEPDFVFGNDYEEYFQQLDWQQADTIFDGVLEPSNQRKFRYVDTSVGIGFTGAYWVQLRGDSLPVGPMPVRVRDPDVWWSYETVQDELDQVRNLAPDAVRLETIGHTVRGRAIPAVFVGEGSPCIAFVGLIHPGESGPELLIPALRRLLAERPELLKRASVAMLPAVGIDGREAQVAGAPWYIRVNSNGVDLNRNLGADWDTVSYGYGLDSSDPDSATYRGPAPGSEPETQAVLAFVERARPVALFSFHCLASICSNAFLVSAQAAGDTEYVRRATRIATWYQRGMFPAMQGDADLTFACTSGSLPHWLYKHRQTPSFDLELGPDQDAKACIQDKTTRELLDRYRDRHYGGLVHVLENIGRTP